MRLPFHKIKKKKITRTDSIPMSAGKTPDKQFPRVEQFLCSKEKISPAMLVIPGGGYGCVSETGGRPAVEWLNSLGISAFVLSYRCAPYRYPAPFVDALRALQHIRYYAPEYRIDPRRIGVLGMEAGGHLAMLVSTLQEYPQMHENDPERQVSARPDLAVLCDPVISFLKNPHPESVKNLLGAHPKNSMLKKLSGEYRVQPGMPPVFLWHINEESSALTEHSILFSGALEYHHIPHELHLFEQNENSPGPGDGSTAENHRWRQHCEDWLIRQGFGVD